MIKRFVDRSFPDTSLEADAAELMRAAGPTADALEVKQRVRERLMEVRVRRRGGFVLAPAIGIALLAIGTAAGATLGVRWWRGTQTVSQPASLPVRLDPPPPSAPVPRAAAAAAIETPDSASPVSAPASASRGKRARPAGEDAETRLLFEATRALRRDRDPARAGALLDDYFRRFPHGALGEEALAVAIEAASARGDARALALARRYLARYPGGQFRAVAERALAGPAE